MSAYFLCLVLFAIGLYCIVRKRNIIKIIIGIMISEYAINLLFILFAYRKNGRAPLFSEGLEIKNMVDPLPQAVVSTAIVIGLAITVLTVAIALRIYEKYGTFDITRIRRLKG